MRASAWKNGGTTYGIRVRRDDRTSFQPGWIKVEIDGRLHDFKLTDSFWRKCHEFRDARGQVVIRRWLERHFDLPWPRGKPPQVELTALGNNRFRLSRA